VASTARRRILVDTDFHAGCPVLAVSVQEPPTDEIQRH
jgi:hypothetical protein